VTILIKPLLYLVALGQVAVLFASTVGLACWLLMKCVRAIAWLLPSSNSANVSTLHLGARPASEDVVPGVVLTSGPPANTLIHQFQRQYASLLPICDQPLSAKVIGRKQADEITKGPEGTIERA
jgi:hypothetical protein